MRLARPDRIDGKIALLVQCGKFAAACSISGAWTKRTFDASRLARHRIGRAQHWHATAPPCGCGALAAATIVAVS